MKVLKVIGWVVFGLCAASTLGLLLGLPVMWLWNWLMPAIFGLPSVTYWQAVGLLILSHLLFKGHGRFDRPRREHGKRWDRFASRVQSAVEDRRAAGPVD